MRANLFKSQCLQAVLTAELRQLTPLYLIGVAGLTLGLLSQQVQAAESVLVNNMYQEKYTEQNNTQLKSLNENPKTVLEAGQNQEADNTKMLEEGYDLMGTSTFVSPSVASEHALTFAQKIKADTVLVYTKEVPVNTKLVSLDGSEEGEKQANEVNQANAKTAHIIHHASFWAKLPPPLLGVHVIKLIPSTNKEGAPIAPEVKGLTAIAVIKDSPAAKAHLTKGDSLLKIGEQALEKPEDLFAAVKRYAGQTVQVVVQRYNGEMQTVSIALNQRR